MVPALVVGGIIGAGILLFGDDDEDNSADKILEENDFNVREVDEDYVRKHLEMGGRDINDL